MAIPPPPALSVTWLLTHAPVGPSVSSYMASPMPLVSGPGG
jgi:hypothetical protein